MTPKNRALENSTGAIPRERGSRLINDISLVIKRIEWPGKGFGKSCLESKTLSLTTFSIPREPANPGPLYLNLYAPYTRTARAHGAKPLLVIPFDFSLEPISPSSRLFGIRLMPPPTPGRVFLLIPSRSMQRRKRI